MHACGGVWLRENDTVQRSTHTVITLTAFCILRQREKKRERGCSTRRAIALYLPNFEDLC